ncbi:hypothetical protein USB125703_00831 [Pseudoclavibacter triregionum]|nr:hypothetical protein USB125703_00831 [Pseudoclavibacter triregionum]
MAYDSQYSTTGEVADVLGAALAAHGPQVDVRHVRTAPDPSGYDAVVAGAPVHANAWKSGAAAWLHEHRQTLATIPHALFLTSMSFALDPDRPGQQREKTDLLQQTASREGLRPVAVAPFAGAVDLDVMGGAAGMVYMGVSRTMTTGDYRDWGAIAAWGLELAPLLRLPDAP